jgi:hypothetical protein
MVLAINKIFPHLAVKVTHRAGQDILVGEIMEHPPNFRHFLDLGFANHFAAIGLRKDYDSVIIYRLYHEVKGKTTMSVIAKDNYVALEYRLWLDSGEQLRGTPEAPAVLTFVAGCNELMPGLERRLLGLRGQDAVGSRCLRPRPSGTMTPILSRSGATRFFPRP